MEVKDEKKIVKNPLVTVQVYAYNKEDMIKQCLDSVINQETNFEYDILIMHNPGTDSTQDICLEYQKKYPEKIILILREKNMGFFYNYYRAAEISRGKYISRCDADDYWCDEHKLQKQVDFLESHPDYGCCYTRSRNYDETTKTFSDGSLPWRGFKADLLRESIQQPSVMYRKDLFEKFVEEIKPEEKGWLMEDTPRTYWFANNSKIARLDDITAVYRVVNNSASHQTDYKKQSEYHKSILDVRLFFYDKYCPGETELIKPLYNDYYRRNINAAYAAHNYKELIANICHYRYSNLSEVIANTKIVIKLIVKSIIGRK